MVMVKGVGGQVWVGGQRIEVSKVWEEGRWVTLVGSVRDGATRGEPSGKVRDVAKGSRKIDVKRAMTSREVHMLGER